MSSPSSSTSSMVQLPAPTHTPDASSPSITTNPIDDFFGHELSRSANRESRHDRRLSSSDVPPPYQAPPEYSAKAEPITLAAYLFKFGFLFPPFWILGAIILLSPLRAPSPSSDLEWLPEKTEAERQAVISRLRKTEKKWAWRCLLALSTLLAFALAAGFTIWAMTHL
ncbi:hypothetical protein C8J56DRAFT_802681 [Mycena floridula]|nr:hypothetical protein C8J56DRAFT_802681 [Mycena floridula]